MPGVAAVKEVVKQAIRKELLKGDDPVAIATGEAVRTPGQRVAFVKTKLEGREVTSQSGQLPDRMEDMIDAYAEAIAKVILSLRVNNVSVPTIPVTIPVTSATPLPSAGVVIAIPTAPGVPNVDLLTLVDES